jgi:hypothetical protein
MENNRAGDGFPKIVRNYERYQKWEEGEMWQMFKCYYMKLSCWCLHISKQLSAPKRRFTQSRFAAGKGVGFKWVQPPRKAEAKGGKIKILDENTWFFALNTF